MAATMKSGREKSCAIKRICFTMVQVLTLLQLCSGSDLTQDEKDIIVDLHNSFRSDVYPPASNMLKLEWDDDLANLAKGWSEQCSWNHGHPSNIQTSYNTDKLGQNLWLGSAGSSTSRPSFQGVLNSWHSEHRHYTYESNSCGDVCGHYTQVVWAKTEKVGCGFAHCPTVSGKNSKNVFIVTCNYYPAGNLRHATPYKNGTQCNKCSTNGWCQNRMCKEDCRKGQNGCSCYLRCHNCGTLNFDTCTCACAEGWSGTDCTVKCEDKSSKCGKNPGFPKSLCNSQDSVRENCPLLCGECSEPDMTKQCEPTSLPCDDVVCENNRDVILETCDCDCGSVYQGDVCQFRKDEAANGIILTLTGSIDQWTDTMSTKVRAKVLSSVNDQCTENVTICCANAGPNDRWVNIEARNIVVGTGYPVATEGKDRYDVLLVSQVPSTLEEKCEDALVHQDGMYKAISSALEELKTEVKRQGSDLVEIRRGEVSSSSTITFHLLLQVILTIVSLQLMRD